ncbi:MAG TPA: hypothetical protein VJ698_03075 [Noviherbaspirillum sp.]|uniref:FFLEELY motif protein n=1 Tax=Noviherbaspirillum sp. TaxID=1926288 RepID=UPI002B48E2C5|nr:hypothetical protein [Noviherbaspirillum sp.]HJV84433.1 hypothetical protein [Noviherbaspirillum sp.]
MDKQQIIAELHRDLESVLAERQAARAFPEAYAARTALRQFQSDRMSRTHADLLEDSETRAAANFFLSDLYGPHDLSQRDTNLQRALPTIERMLPVPALAGVAEAISLDALSERLDAGMANLLGAEFSETGYVDAYRKVGTRADRARQLDHVDRLGAALTDLVGYPLIGKTLSLMKMPAKLAGVAHLHDFLERGFKAFEAMRKPQDFVDKVVTRERQIMDQIYSGKKKPFVLD